MLKNTFTGFSLPKQKWSTTWRWAKMLCTRIAHLPFKKNNGLPQSVRQNGVYVIAVVACLWWDEHNILEKKEKGQSLSENLKCNTMHFYRFDTTSLAQLHCLTVPHIMTPMHPPPPHPHTPHLNHHMKGTYFVIINYWKNLFNLQSC